MKNKIRSLLYFIATLVAIMIVILYLKIEKYNKANKAIQTIPDFNYVSLNGENFSNRDIPDVEYKCFIYYEPGCNSCKPLIKSVTKSFNEYPNVFFLLITKDSLKINIISEDQIRNSNTNIACVQQKEDFSIKTFEDLIYPTILLYDKNNQLIKKAEGTVESLAILSRIKNEIE